MEQDANYQAFPTACKLTKGPELSSDRVDAGKASMMDAQEGPAGGAYTSLAGVVFGQRIITWHVDPGGDGVCQLGQSPNNPGFEVSAVREVVGISVNGVQRDKETAQERDEGVVVEKDGNRIMAVALEVEPLRLEELAEAGNVDLIVDLGEFLDRLRRRPQARLDPRRGARMVDDLIDLEHLY